LINHLLPTDGFHVAMIQDFDEKSTQKLSDISLSSISANQKNKN